MRPRRRKRRKRTSYLDSVNNAATKDSDQISESEVSESEVKDEFYLSDVVSTNTTQHNPNNTLTTLRTHPITGPTPTLNNMGGPRQKRRRRIQFTKEMERSHYLLHLIAKDVENVGVHVVHKNIVLTKDELCVLSLGTTFLPNARKHNRKILSYALNKCIRNVRLQKHFATFDIEKQSTITPESLLHTRVNKTLSLEEAKEQFNPTTTIGPIENYLTEIRGKVQAEGYLITKVRHLERRKWTYFYDTIHRLKT